MDTNNGSTWIYIQERKSRLINDPQRVNVLNPSFTANSPTIKWTDNTDSWDVVFGQIYFNYVFPIAANLLWQQLSGFTLGAVYTVQFKIVDSTQGYVTAKLGDDAHAFSGNGFHSFDATIDEDESSVQRISFRAEQDGSNWFNGGVTDVSIVKNMDLSPKKSIFWYEPKGTVTPVNDIGLALNFEIANVAELGKSRGSRTKTVQIVAAEADRVFGHLSDINTTFDSFDPRYRFRANVITNGDSVFEGFASLERVVINGNEHLYEIVIVDDAASFTEDANQFDLSDLNLTAYDHELNITNIMAKSGATYANGDVYCYPTLWTDDTDSYRVKDYFPAFFFKAVWDRSCEALGYRTVFSDPFVQAKLEQAVIPYSGKPKLLSEADVQKLSTRVALRDYQSWKSSFYRQNDDWASTDTWNDRVHFNTPEYDEEGQWDITLFQFVADQTLDYTVDCYVPCDIYTELIGDTAAGMALWEFTDTQTMFAELSFRLNGQLLDSVQFSDDAGGYQFNTAPSNGVNGTLLMALTGQTYSLNQGDVLSVHVSHAQRHRFILPPFFYHGSIAVSLIPQLTDGATNITITATKSEVGEGSTIQLTSYLPNLTFGDLVNYARKKFNLYIHASEYDPYLIHLDTRNDFYSNAEQLDWSDKLALDHEYWHEPIPTLVSEAFLFADAKASDNFNKNYSELNAGATYGELKVDLGTDLSKGTTTIGPNKFAATPIAKNRFGHHVPALDARNMPNEPRVLLFSGAAYGLGPDDGLPVRYWNGTANVTGMFPVSHCLMEDSLTNMDFTLTYAPPRISILTGDAVDYTTAGCYERYWSEYIEQVRSGKMFTGYFYLITPDIVKLKKGLNKVVHLNGQNYTINRVIDHQPNKAGLTKCELLLLDSFHGLFNTKRTTVRPFTHTGFMHNLPPGIQGVLGPNGGVTQGSGNKVASTRKSVGVYGDNNFVGANAEKVLVVGSNATVNAGVKDAAAIGVRYGATLSEDGQVMIGDFVEVTGAGELVEHHWFVGGIDEAHTGLDQFTTDYPVIIIGGSETEARQAPIEVDDEQHWFITGGDEGSTYPVAPPERPIVGR